MPAHQYATNPNAKRILIVCDEGNNRSVTIAGQLKYWGHDTLTVGLNRNTDATIGGLADGWAESIILTSNNQLAKFRIACRRMFAGWNRGRDAWTRIEPKIQIWELGPDTYNRPYNKELLAIVKTHINKHRKELAPKKD